MVKFEKFMLDLNTTNFCIVGDLNARISEEQTLDNNFLQELPHFQVNRCSKDKTCNAQGRRLIDFIDNIGGIVLNGRTIGDEHGEFSFCGVMGSSVIDYGICSLSFLKYVNGFFIASKPFSDHMPLCIKIKPIYRDDRNEDTNSKLPRLRWNNKQSSNYVEKLSFLTEIVDLQSNNDVDDVISSITSKIKQAASFKANKKIFEPKQKWFNWKCVRYRNRMFKSLKRYRKNHTDANKISYFVSKSKYIKLCKSKKLEFYNKNLEKLNNVKCCSEWWKLSSSLKSSPHHIKGNLNAEDFRLHFSSMLQTNVNENEINWCMPYFTDAFLDSPIELCEILSVIKTLKLNKSPGQDERSLLDAAKSRNLFLI